MSKVTQRSRCRSRHRYRCVSSRVFTRPTAIADSAILAALRHGWGLDAVAATYLAAGFGSHHWVTTGSTGVQWFVTVDDLAARDFLGRDPVAAFDGLGKAFSVAYRLHQCGSDWVVAPVADPDGRVVRRLDATYSIAVFPYVKGTVTEEYGSDAERRTVVELLAELHQSVKSVASIVRREDFRLPNRADLEAALASIDRRWVAGPYAEPARLLLTRHIGGVERLLDDYDRLAGQALLDQSDWTITHGEPHSANILRTDTGMRLIDWDTALLAPPERDLWMLLPDPYEGDTLAEHYAASTGHHIDVELLRLYRLWWDLTEIGIYLAGFRATHADTEDMRESWRNLQLFIQADRRWPID